MLRLSKLADYATVMMVHICREAEHPHTAKEVAEATHLQLPTVSKLLKLLTAARLLDSQRGSKGGYTLARQPEDIGLDAIVAAVEGPVALTECASGVSGCQLEGSCSAKGNWQLINEAVMGALANISLRALAEPEQTLLKHELARLRTSRVSPNVADGAH